MCSSRTQWEQRYDFSWYLVSGLLILSHILDSVPNFTPQLRPPWAQSVASLSWPMVWRHHHCASDVCVLVVTSHFPCTGLTQSLYSVALGLDDVSGTLILFDSEILVLASTYVVSLADGLSLSSKPSSIQSTPWPATKHSLLI